MAAAAIIAYPSLDNPPATIATLPQLPSTHAVDQYASTSTKLSARLAIHAYSTSPLGWFPWLTTRLPLAGAVLEVGAGTGELWRHITDRSAISSLTLTDFSPAMCDALRDVAASTSTTPTTPTTTVLRADATALPFPDASFDGLIANHMLYHVDSPRAALAEFARVLRPGGRLAVALNARDHLQELLEVGEAIGRPSRILESASVTAETALELFGEGFGELRMEQFPGDLLVPQPEPLLDYLESWADEPMTAEQIKKAKEAIEPVIARNGAFRVRKRMFLFTAIRR